MAGTPMKMITSHATLMILIKNRGTTLTNQFTN
jgi:hypothetical protein